MRRNPILVKSVAGVSAAAVAVTLPFAFASASLASSKASSSDLCSTASVSPSDGVTATTHTVSVGGVNKNVCELTFKTVVTSGNTMTTSSTWTVPVDVSKVDYVVVAGGGGGGAGYLNNDAGGGGGGGGGEALTGTDLSVSGTINVVVGAGGQGGQNDNDDGADGNPSSLSTVTARPGKAGFAYDSLATGGDSGSGQKGGDYKDQSQSPWEQLGGGGGGQVAQGQDATVTTGGDGGAGFTAQIGGLFGAEAADYSGGGGGGVGGAHTAGKATQGGGAGAVGTSAGANALSDSGGGGGGGAGTSSSWSKGGNGAGGIVRVRFLLPDSEPTPTPNPTPGEQLLPAGVGLPSKAELQSSLATTGSYVVLKKKAITNAGQRVRVAVSCPAVKSLTPSGDVRACWVKRTKSGKVTLYVRDVDRVQATLRMFAPATEDFNRLNVSKRYSLRLR